MNITALIEAIEKSNAKKGPPDYRSIEQIRKTKIDEKIKAILSQLEELKQLHIEDNRYYTCLFLYKAEGTKHMTFKATSSPSSFVSKDVVDDLTSDVRIKANPKDYLSSKESEEILDEIIKQPTDNYQK